MSWLFRDRDSERESYRYSRRSYGSGSDSDYVYDSSSRRRRPSFDYDWRRPSNVTKHCTYVYPVHDTILCHVPTEAKKPAEKKEEKPPGCKCACCPNKPAEKPPGCKCACCPDKPAEKKEEKPPGCKCACCPNKPAEKPPGCKCACCPNKPAEDDKSKKAADEVPRCPLACQGTGWLCRPVRPVLGDCGDDWSRDLVEVVDKTGGPLSRRHGERFPVSIAAQATVDDIIMLLAPERHRYKVVVRWRDGDIEDLDDMIGVDEIRRHARRLYVKDRKCVRWA